MEPTMQDVRLAVFVTENDPTTWQPAEKAESIRRLIANPPQDGYWRHWKRGLELLDQYKIVCSDLHGNWEGAKNEIYAKGAVGEIDWKEVEYKGNRYRMAVGLAPRK